MLSLKDRRILQRRRCFRHDLYRHYSCFTILTWCTELIIFYWIQRQVHWTRKQRRLSYRHIIRLTFDRLSWKSVRTSVTPFWGSWHQFRLFYPFCFRVRSPYEGQTNECTALLTRLRWLNDRPNWSETNFSLPRLNKYFGLHWRLLCYPFLDT